MVPPGAYVTLYADHICGQKVEGGGSAPLPHSGETPLGVLRPALELSAHDRHGCVEAGPEEATKMF